MSNPSIRATIPKCLGCGEPTPTGPRMWGPHIVCDACGPESKPKVVGRRDTGAATLAALARRHPDVGARVTLRELFEIHGGDATATARDVGVGKKSLMAAVTSLGLDGWLAETWPNRAKGGQRYARRARVKS